jgi:thymidylate kinase
MTDQPSARTPASTPTPGERLPAVDRAVRSLAAANFAWSILRGSTDGVDVGEIDLLVAPDAAMRLATTLAAAGFARIPTWGHGSHRFYVAYESGPDRWVKLDVVTSLEFRSGHRLPSQVVAAVLGRRMSSGGVPRLHPADEFWAQLLHCLLDRGRLRERDRAELRALVANVVDEGPVYDRLAAAARARSVAPELAARGDERGLLQLARPLAACLERAGPMDRARRRAARLLTPLVKAVRRPGITVALLGPDGAGKSTLIRSLATTFYYPARTYYLGLYGAQRPRLGRLSSLPGAELIAQIARLWRVYLLAGYHRRRGRLVLFDRHGYEALLTFRSRPSLKRRLRRILVGRLSPGPDLVLVLDAPPELLHARKAEHDPQALARQRAAYRRLATELERRGRGVLVDATADAAAVRRTATALIWQRVARRR